MGMKILNVVLVILTAALGGGCIVQQNYQGMELASSGITTQTLRFGGAKKAELVKALERALVYRDYTIKSSSGGTVKAELIRTLFDKELIVAKYTITVKDGEMTFETQGSTYYGTPYLPVRYIKFLKKDITRELGW